MPINTKCPECLVGYRLPDNAAGKRIKCKECGGPISVPGGNRKPAPKRKPHDEFEDDDFDVSEYDDFGNATRRRRDDDDDYDDPMPRRRKQSGGKRATKSKSGGGGFRWGPLVALLGIPLLLVGFLIEGTTGAVVGIVLMNVAFGVSATISAIQKGHSPGLAIPLALIGLLGLFVVAFLPDHAAAPAKKTKRRRR